MIQVKSGMAIPLGLLAFSMSMPTAVFNIFFGIALFWAALIIKKEEFMGVLKNELNWALWASLVFLLIGLLLTSTENFTIGLDYCLRRSYFLLMPFLFFRSNKQIYQAISFSFCAGVVTGFLICMFHVQAAEGVYGSIEQIYISNWYWSDRLLEPIDKHPSYFSFYATLSFFLSLRFFLTPSNRSLTLITGVLTLISLGILLTLESRLFILIFPFLVILYIYRVYKNRMWALYATFFLIGIGTLYFFLHPARLHNIRMKDLPRAAEVRLEIYRSTWGLIKENMLFGVGTGDFGNMLFAKYGQDKFAEGQKRKYNAHNQYMEDWARGGILSLFALFYLWIVAFKRGRRNVPEHMILVCAGILFLMVESAFNRQQGITFMVFFLCLYQTMPLVLENHGFSDSREPPGIKQI